LTEPTPRQLLDVAIDAALSAGAIVKRHFENGVAADTKKDGTPVTIADRESERELRRVIGKAFPTHAILGEEEGESAGDSAYRWILDPIDGTKTFVAGVPLFGVLVGLEVRGDPMVGVIHLPALNETIAAARGEGCSRDGWPCHVSTTSRVEDALIVGTSSRSMRRSAPRYAELADRAKTERTWGDCYGYALVASGRADIAVDDRLHPWDLCAVMPIVEEAGGRLTNWAGERSIRGPTALMTNGTLHDEVLGYLRTK
jgi:histidinol phosphatase-like enzyme (inositol monophosphatase family)